jgi:NADP-dependent 3-hydroxy acid dehydrogenase YdfG
VPNQAVYAGTKNAVRALSEGLRQEAGDAIRGHDRLAGFIRTDFAGGAADPKVREQLLERRAQVAIRPDAIAFAIAQPVNVNVNEIVVRPTAPV